MFQHGRTRHDVITVNVARPGDREDRHVSHDPESLLTKEQQRRLPTFVTPFLDTRYLASVRSGTAGAGLGMMMMPGGMPVPAAVGAGGGNVQIIRIGTP